MPDDVQKTTDPLADALTEYGAVMRHGLSGKHDAGFLRAVLARHGLAVVPREAMPEAVGAWWRVKNGHHYHDEPPPTDRSDYTAYRALIRAAAVEPAR